MLDENVYNTYVINCFLEMHILKLVLFSTFLLVVDTPRVHSGLYFIIAVYG